MPSIVWKPATWQSVITESDGSDVVETEKGIRLGNWGVCKDKRTGKWAVCLITWDARRATYTKSMAEAKALVEAFGVEDVDLLLIKGESDFHSHMNTLLRIVKDTKLWKGEHKPSLAETRETVQQFLSANLQPIGTYNGKAGEFWGVIKGGDKGARAISLGAREVLLNVFYVQQEVDRSKPDTRWLMQKSELITKITEDTLKKWAAWVKAGPTMKELRRAARERALSGQNAYLSGASKLAASGLAFEHPSEDALKKYLKDHPDADKSKHTVMKSVPKRKDPISLGQSLKLQQVQRMKEEQSDWGSKPSYQWMYSAGAKMAADPTYKDYVEKKKKDGEKPLEKDEWESRVLGKGKKDEKEPSKAHLPSPKEMKELKTFAAKSRKEIDSMLEKRDSMEKDIRQDKKDLHKSIGEDDFFEKDGEIYARVSISWGGETQNLNVGTGKIEGSPNIDLDSDWVDKIKEKSGDIKKLIEKQKAVGDYQKKIRALSQESWDKAKKFTDMLPSDNPLRDEGYALDAVLPLVEFAQRKDWQKKTPEEVMEMCVKATAPDGDESNSPAHLVPRPQRLFETLEIFSGQKPPANKSSKQAASRIASIYMVAKRSLDKRAANKEYIIWGIPGPDSGGGSDDTLLLESVGGKPITSHAEAQRYMKILVEKYGCRRCRIQELDMSKEFVWDTESLLR